ncbi:MAG TPA: hypothetical protein VFE62_09135 [Gemmataceae bacterium]|nr:hypothetical protein [Gemmataceae bacterium]
MRSRLLLGVCLLAGIAAPSYAQDPVESVSANFVVKTLKAMECQFSVTKEHVAIELNDRKFNLYRLDGGGRLLLKAHTRSLPSLTTVNRYNERIAVTTRAVRYPKDGVVLEAGLDCSLGVTQQGLEKFLTRFSNQIGDFEKFIASNQEKDPDQPIAKKGEKQKVPMQIAPGKDEKELMITFPTNDPENWETAWKIVWDMESAKQAAARGYKFGNGGRTVLFTIKQAFFKPGRNAEWIQVLEDAHPQEFYVPYYFRNTRFYDLRDVGGYVKLSPKEGGATSQVLSKAKQVIAELRDTGTAYKHGNITRRGEELTLLANFAAANYTYMIEYGFRDDGGIVFRHSPTGYNYFPHFDASHMHGSYWHIGMKLGPQGNNTVNQVYSVSLPRDPKLQGDNGKLNIEEVTTEKFIDWHPEEFTRIRVTNPNYNILPAGKDRPAYPIAYDLVTYPQGTARHRRFADEAFTLHDFWITRHDCPEKMYTQIANHFRPKNGEKREPTELDKQNVTIWHSSSGLHTPRAEDGILNGNGTANGQATIYWTVFELRPRNMFLKTPIYRSLPQ